MTADRGPMSRALADSLKSAAIDDRDRGSVALARRLAQLLDAARGEAVEWEVFKELAPKYLAVLGALGLTPAARGSQTTPVPAGPTKLDELRARRQRGAAP